MFDLTTYEIVRKKYHAEGEWIVQWCTLYIKFILLFICEKIFYMRWLFTKFICKFRFCSLSPFCDTTETIRRDCVTRWIIFGRIIQLNPYLYVHWWFSKNLNTLLLWYFIVNFLLASVKLLANSKSPPSNPLQELWSCDLYKHFCRIFQNHMWLWNIVQEAAQDMYNFCTFSRIFPTSNEGWRLEEIDQ